MKTEEARRLANILLEHHRHLRTDLKLTPETVTTQHMLPYGELCARADLEYLTQSVGHFLGQVAEWCYEKRVPPLNSLAVNAATKVPATVTMEPLVVAQPTGGTKFEPASPVRIILD